ncbi:hypothetical protein OHA21_49590 [Actinoplanes sp. NBC_00393]|uniref:hypothetical protein n=1 Tax=Actinoplanes sp. NBC_00393 TaxID=2975953 RepID=UPI002E1C468B
MPSLFYLGNVAIGAAFRAGETTAEALARIRAAGEAAGERAAAETGGMRERLAALAERGAAETAKRETEARARAAAAWDATLTAIASSPLINRIVDVQVDRMLDLFENEPDRIQGLVRGARDTMVGEVVGRVRAGAAAGDAAVDRLTLRMSRRGGGADPT